eukprot:1192400-Prorocentrum_minimum.AAC.6
MVHAALTLLHEHLSQQRVVRRLCANHVVQRRNGASPSLPCSRRRRRATRRVTRCRARIATIRVGTRTTNTDIDADAVHRVALLATAPVLVGSGALEPSNVRRRSVLVCVGPHDALHVVNGRPVPAHAALRSQHHPRGATRSGPRGGTPYNPSEAALRS